MICLWYITERSDKTEGWLEIPGTVKSDLQNDHLTKLNGVQYTVCVYTILKKMALMWGIQHVWEGGLLITPQSFV